MRIIQTAVLLIAAMIATGALAENIWDLQAVDATGLGTHPKVGASVSDPGNRVVIEGIALNNTAEYLNTASSWQIYVQAESPDKGGIAAWAGTFYRNTPWPRYPLDINAGDRVRIEGFLMNTRGKVNIN
ncbi:MAG TPA: hypothetical protein PLS31_06435, partial [Candidatus Sumerlaeota bacterium]|nr:hypothetical protein [Candidatus Sumerlaeota bacterium]